MTFEFVGDLNLQNANLWFHRLLDFLSLEHQGEKQGQILYFDYSKTKSLDAGHIAILLRILKMLNKQQRKLILLNVDEKLRSVFNLYRVENFFTFETKLGTLSETN